MNAFKYGPFVNMLHRIKAEASIPVYAGVGWVEGSRQKYVGYYQADQALS